MSNPIESLLFTIDLKDHDSITKKLKKKFQI